MGFYRRVVGLRRSFAMTTEVDGNYSVVWCEVLELRVPITACTAKGVYKNQRRRATVDMGVRDHRDTNKAGRLQPECVA